MVKHAVEPEELQAYLDDELESPRRREVESHVKECTECARLLDDLKRVSATLQQWQVAPAPATLRPPKVKEHRRRLWLWQRPALTYAGGIAVILVAGIVGLTIYQDWQIQPLPEQQDQTQTWSMAPPPSSSKEAVASPRAGAVPPKETFRRQPAYATVPKREAAELAKKEAPEEPQSATRALKAKPSVMADRMARSEEGAAAGGMVNEEKAAPQAALSAPSGAAASGRLSANQAIGMGNLAAPSAAEPHAQSTSAPRWIAYHVAMEVEVKDFDAARGEVEKDVTAAGGYVSQASTQETPNQPRHASLTLRVPADQLQSVLADLRTLGRVTSEQLSTDELTDQMVDLDARLRNARETEQRLREVLEKRTGKVGEVLDVEREISSTREEIERMEAKRANLQNRVTFATVDVTLQEHF